MHLTKITTTAAMIATAFTIASCEADTATATAPAAPGAGPAPVVEAANSSLTRPQQNAVRSARSYLDMKGFSRAGLIKQLSSEYGEGFSVADATAAVDSLTVDWNENAARAGASYLEMKGFSCSGLTEQLSSEYGDGFTTSQARYGAAAAGAC